MKGTARASAEAALLLLSVLSGCATSPPQLQSADPGRVELGLQIRGDATPLTTYQFVLYDTGLVIFKRRTAPQLYEFFWVALSPEEMGHLAGELRVNDLFGLDGYYDLSEATSDLPTYSIEVYDSRTNGRRQFRVRGILSEDGRRFDMDMTDAAPAAFVRVYERLDSYSHPRERKWFPKYVEIPVSLTGGTGSACEWPSEWESRESPASTRLPVPQPTPAWTKLGTVRVKGERLPDVERFLADCHKKNGELTVLLNGQRVWMYLSVDLPLQTR